MSSNDDTKQCRMCNTVKPIIDFGKYTRNKKDGLRNECKPCINAYLANFRQAKKNKCTSTIQDQINDKKSDIYALDDHEIDKLENMVKDLSELISLRKEELQFLDENMSH